MKQKSELTKIISITMLPPGFFASGFILGLGDDGILYTPSVKNDGIWLIWE